MAAFGPGPLLIFYYPKEEVGCPPKWRKTSINRLERCYPCQAVPLEPKAGEIAKFVLT